MHARNENRLRVSGKEGRNGVVFITGKIYNSLKALKAYNSAFPDTKCVP